MAKKKKQSNYEKILASQAVVGHKPTKAEIAAALATLGVKSIAEGGNMTKTANNRSKHAAINVLRATFNASRAQGAPGEPKVQPTAKPKAKPSPASAPASAPAKSKFVGPTTNRGKPVKTPRATLVSAIVPVGTVRFTALANKYGVNLKPRRLVVKGAARQSRLADIAGISTTGKLIHKSDLIPKTSTVKAPSVTPTRNARTEIAEAERIRKSRIGGGKAANPRRTKRGRGHPR